MIKHFYIFILLIQAELEKMMSTIKLLQAKNASTGKEAQNEANGTFVRKADN